VSNIYVFVVFVEGSLRFSGTSASHVRDAGRLRDDAVQSGEAGVAGNEEPPPRPTAEMRPMYARPTRMVSRISAAPRRPRFAIRSAMLTEPVDLHPQFVAHDGSSLYLKL
jgi:hypothetical protein